MILKLCRENGFLFLPIAAFFGLSLCLDFDGFYGQDSYEHLRYSRALKLFFETGVPPETYGWPVLYALLGAVLSYIMNDMLALQFESFIAFIGVLIVLKKAIYLLYDLKDHKVVSLFLLLGASTSPYFFRAGIVGMTDMLSAFFVISAIYFMLKCALQINCLSFVLLFACGAASVITRYATFPIICPVLMYGIFLALRAHRERLLLFGFLTLLVVCLPHFILKGVNFEFLQHNGLLKWSLSHFMNNHFITQDGEMTYDFINGLYVFLPFVHPGYLSVGLLLLPFYKFTTPSVPQKILLLAAVLYLFFLAGLETQNMRFFIPVYPLLLLLLSSVFVRAYLCINQSQFRMLVVFGVLLVNTIYFTFNFKKFYELSQLEKTIAADLQTRDLSTPIYAFYVDVSLPYRGVSNEIRNMWITSYENFQKGAFVLFNVTKFKKQWANTNPMINWENMNKAYNLVKITSYKSGWHLYYLE